MLVKAKVACLDNITGAIYPEGTVFELPKGRAEKAIKAGFVEKAKENDPGDNENDPGDNENGPGDNE